MYVLLRDNWVILYGAPCAFQQIRFHCVLCLHVMCLDFVDFRFLASIPNRCLVTGQVEDEQLNKVNNEAVSELEAKLRTAGITE